MIANLGNGTISAVTLGPNPVQCSIGGGSKPGFTLPFPQFGTTLGPDFTPIPAGAIAARPGDAARYFVGANFNFYVVRANPCGTIDVVEKTVSIGPATSIAVDSSGSRAYVADTNGRITVVDVNPSSQTYGSVLATAFTGNSIPAGIALSPDQSTLFVALPLAEQIALFDAAANRIDADGDPSNGPTNVSLSSPDGTAATGGAGTQGGPCMPTSIAAVTGPAGYPQMWVSCGESPIIPILQ